MENQKAWAPIHDGIVDGCESAASRTGMSWGLIPDISPHLPAADCAQAMSEVLDHDLSHILAIGMGGPSATWTTDNFGAIYAAARERGVPGVAHAGEHGGPDEVRWALDEFQAVRIQHGIGAMQDPETAAMLRDRGIACDVCPGSNLALKAVSEPEAHPLPQMLAEGLTVTLGTDDPPMFQTTLLDEYARAWAWADLSVEELRGLCRNSIEHSFATQTNKAAWLAQLSPS